MYKWHLPHFPQSLLKKMVEDTENDFSASNGQDTDIQHNMDVDDQFVYNSDDSQPESVSILESYVPAVAVD